MVGCELGEAELLGPILGFALGLLEIEGNGLG